MRGSAITNADKERPLKVAVDARPLTEPPCGIRRYLECLLPALLEADKTLRLVLISQTSFSLQLQFQDRIDIRLVPGPKNTLLRPIWDLWRLPSQLRQPGLDLFFSPYGTIPGGNPIPTVVTIQDVAFLKNPKLLPWHYRLPWRWMSRRWPMAARCIVPSETTRKEVLDTTSVDPDLVDVVWHAVDRRFQPPTEMQKTAVQNQFALEGPFVLWVGTREPRKNLDLLLEAFARINSIRRKPLTLVLVGRKGWGRQLAARTQKPWIRVLEGVSDESLASLYGAASVFAFPSLDEGFGLPPLEAMACGTAVIVSDAGSLPEVVGSAAEVLPPNNAHVWADVLVRVIDDEGFRLDLERRAVIRAKDFSWTRAAMQTLDIFRNVRRTYR